MLKMAPIAWHDCRVRRIALGLFAVVVLVAGLVVVVAAKPTSTAFGSVAVHTPTHGPLSRKPAVRPGKGQPPKRLTIRDIVKGTGTPAKSGDSLTVNYVGVLYRTGHTFDSSWFRHELFSFDLGRGWVIESWERGLVGMRVGGRRELIVPPRLAYGSQRVGTVPPNETVVFIVDLLAE